MSKCIKCGTNFVGTPENPPTEGLCKYCEIQDLKQQLTAARADAERLAHGIIAFRDFGSAKGGTHYDVMITALAAHEALVKGQA